MMRDATGRMNIADVEDTMIVSAQDVQVWSVRDDGRYIVSIDEPIEPIERCLERRMVHRDDDDTSARELNTRTKQAELMLTHLAARHGPRLIYLR